MTDAIRPKQQELLERIKLLFFQLHHGSSAPQGHKDFIEYTVLRDKFMNPKAVFPQKGLTQGFHNRTQRAAKKLSQKLVTLLNNPKRFKFRLHKSPLNDEEKDQKIREMMQSIFELTGKEVAKKWIKDPKSPEKLKSIRAEAPKVPRNETKRELKKRKEEGQVLRPKGKVEIPIVLNVDLGGGIAADPDQVIETIREAFQEKPGQHLARSIRHRLKPLLPKEDREDSVQVHIPERIRVDQPSIPKEHGDPDIPNPKRVRRAIAGKFGKRNFILQWKSGHWIVTIPNYGPRKVTAAFKTIEDRLSGIGDTGLNFEYLGNS